MKDISKYLLHFLKSNQLTDKTIHLSDKSKQFLQIIYHHILKADTSWRKNSHLIKEMDIELIEGSQFVKGNAYKYIPKEIQPIIETLPKWQKQYEIQANGRTYKIAMILPIREKISKHKASKFFNDSLYKIYLWLYVASQFASPDCSKQMDIHLYFTDHLKVLSKTKMQPLNEIHANTAMTTSCSPSTEIDLYRSEEWFKVFIHETFHNLGMDFSDMDCSESDRIILGLFPIKKMDVRLFESYCEMWAEIMNVVFLVFLSTHQSRRTRKRSKPNNVYIFQKIETYLTYEAMWSTFQCAKVLDHYKLSYSELTDLNCPKAKSARDLQYKENTYILSYYVIKSSLMTQVNDFLEWCYCRGKTMDFKKIPDNILDYCGLVARLYQTPRYLVNLNKAEKWFQTHTNNLDTVEGQTMRMALFEY